MRSFSSFIFIVFALESCNAFYVPATTHTPVLQGKKDFCQDASIGASGVNEAISYSPVNHFYFGGTAHVRPGFNNHNYSGGPHAGCYMNTFSNRLHLNLQSGYGFGNSSYANPMTGADVTGIANYSYFYSQVFIAFRERNDAENYLGIGSNYSIAHLNYRGLYNPSTLGPYPPSFPRNGGFISGFFFLQKSLGGDSNLKFTWMAGAQTALPKISAFDVGGFLNGNLYLLLCCRFGLIYQIHYQDKSEAAK